jgi:glycosyltransferase involved in cell wall biosynthesis
LESAVEWFGPLDANKIVLELQPASAMVVPSYIENSCTAIQEAMLTGTPVVASYTGGLPFIAKEEESALFFPLSDEVMCVHQTKRVIEDRELAERISQKAKAIAMRRNNLENVVSQQLEIYRQIVDQGKMGNV